MKYSVGLDVSVKETAICIVDEAGKVVRESKVATEPQAIIAFLNGAEFEYARIGLEAGPLNSRSPSRCSDGVSRFRRSWLEVEMAVLPTDVGSGGG